MKIKLISIMVAMAVAGCNHDSISNSSDSLKPDISNPGGGGPTTEDDGGPTTEGDGPAAEGGELPDIGVDDPIILSRLSLDGSIMFGHSVLCNGEPASEFSVEQKGHVVCTLDGQTLATFSSPFNIPNSRMAARTSGLELLTLTNADEYKGSVLRQTNVQTLIKNMGNLQGKNIDFNFDSSRDSLTFQNYLRNNLDMPAEEFRELITEKISNDNQVDKQPSTHVPDIPPAVTPGASNDLNSGFVSASAEDNLVYKPTEIILSQGQLLDSQGRPVNGVAYFSNHSRGVTGVSKAGRAMEDGRFEFSWGDTISFAIDTFELGNIRGNKTAFQLTELGAENEGKNAEALVLRYADISDDLVSVPDSVTQVFALYPNVVNEAISLSLSNEDVELDVGGGKTQIVYGEFNQQFSQGIAADIDQALKPSRMAPMWSTLSTKLEVNPEASRILADIQKLWGTTTDVQSKGWKKVERFHVFHDSTNFYGSTGNARGQAAVNIANTAFPVLMARNDNNYWIDFGNPKAWDQKGLAFITEAPSLVKPDDVSAKTATFNLPFISVGELGKGKVMVLGNSRYNSVLVCPNGFSWNGKVDKQGACTASRDSDDMGNFFSNVLRYLTGKNSAQLTVGTNIPYVYFKRAGHYDLGNQAPFVLDSQFAAQTMQMDHFSELNPETMPVVIINGYEYHGNTGGNGLAMSADTEYPKLTQEDVTALIDYVNRGGNVLMMETIINRTRSGEIDRLLDSAGIAFGMGSSVVADGNGPSAGYPDRPRNQREHGIWVIERYAAVEGENGVAPTLPYTIKEDGSVEWKFIVDGKPDDKPSLEMATWTEEDDQGQPVKQIAFIDESSHWQKDEKGQVVYDEHGKPVINRTSLAEAKQRILDAFITSDGTPAYQECSKPYQYEVNCLEYRPGNGIPISGGMFRPFYTELKLGDEEAKAMIKAANLGTNIEALYQHERYFRTKGKQGERLNSVDLNRIYQNMTVWLWNDLDYRYESTHTDELGFQRFTEFLNCYTSNTAGGNTECPENLRLQLNEMSMVYGEGEYAGQMNPSYPLNYMEKPLTRLMLGRSFWDLDIKVDVRAFPGEAKGSQGRTITLDMLNQTTAWFAGNRQPTGQWAVAQQEFTVSVSGENAPVTITIALADDLTGREKHELGLKRPPRMTKSFVIGGENGNPTSKTFTVPYGGLIYAQGGNSAQVNLTFNGTIDAPLYKEGAWQNALNSPAPIGEVVSNSFVFTAPKENLNASGYTGGIAQFAQDLDQFALDLNDFYARDEGVEGQRNRKATSESNPNNRHHFVNDIAISIGAAHSGYPVMNSSFNVKSKSLNTAPLNSWLLWHEVGHNAAEAPFNVDGATEVVNNLLALYMQDRHLGKMVRVEQDIRIAPEFVSMESGHAWGAGGAGERLVMFAQLKEWAETEFQIESWYSGELPTYYSQEDGVKGWNLFKLMHRLTRNADDGVMTLKGENLCQPSGLGKSDQLMLCASYAAQTDLTAFFQAWNPGSKAFIYPDDPKPHYEGGVTPAGVSRVKAQNYPKPSRDPLKINQISQ